MSKKKTITKKAAVSGAAAAAAGAFFASKGFDAHDESNATEAPKEVEPTAQKEVINVGTTEANSNTKNTTKRNISIETIKIQISTFINNIENI